MINQNGNRLDRIEALSEVNSRAIERNTAGIAQLRETIEAEAANIAQLREKVEANTAGIAQLKEAAEAEAANIAQLREKVEANTAGIAQLRETVAVNSHDVAFNAQSIQQLAVIAQTQQQTLQATASALIEEIRGLRAENRRILAYLFGEQDK